MSEFVKKPNLPDKKVKKVIIDYRTNSASVKRLEQLGIDVVKTMKTDRLYNSVCGHADMQIFHLGGNRFVCEPSVYEYYRSKLPNARIIRGKTSVSDKYPFDIAYNGALAGDCFFHNLNFTESTIHEYYKSGSGKLINVKQGYTKCSVCVIAENAIITSDIKICESAKNYGIDAIYVDPSEIKLSGMSNGFVGGICGLIDKHTLAVNGDVMLTSFGRKFVGFCDKHEVSVASLFCGIPEDIGSILPIEQG